jgi:serine/threonine protein kinase
VRKKDFDVVIDVSNVESPNVLLDTGLKVKLADFGLSRVRQSTMQTAATAGTLTHMAPECFEGEYSRKTDVYAFAMTCWEIATQDWPMRNFANQAMLMNAVINKNARPEVRNLGDICVF